MTTEEIYPAKEAKKITRKGKKEGRRSHSILGTCTTWERLAASGKDTTDQHYDRELVETWSSISISSGKTGTEMPLSQFTRMS
jgi:hypothetical protein